MHQETRDAIYISLEVLKQADEYYKWLGSRVRPYVKGKTLEIGAGIGNFAAWVQDAASEYHVAEVDPRLVKTLQRKFDHAILWDVYDPFPTDELYDTIITVNVVEHLENDLLALQSIHRLLAPGGHLILMVPAMQFLYGSLDRSFGHYRRYTKKTMTEVLQRVPFTVLKKEYVNVIGMLGWFLYAKILKRSNLPEQLCGRFNLLMPLLKLERLAAYFIGLSLIIIAKKQ